MDNTTSSLQTIIINPYSAFVFHDDLFTNETVLTNEDWVKANSIRMQRYGTNEWLTNLIRAISTKQTEEIKMLQENPSTAITISPNLTGSHETVILEEDWREANEKLINEIGYDQWLWLLLTTLETK
jgi:hypothetical protein